MSLLLTKRLFSIVHSFENIEKLSSKQSSIFSPAKRVQVGKNSPFSITGAFPLPIAGDSCMKSSMDYVGSLRSPSNLLSSLTLILPLGSITENKIYHGYSHLLQALSFKSSKNISQMKLVRLAEARGMHLEAILDREHLILEFAVKLFAETVATTSWEVSEFEAAKNRILLETLKANSSASCVAMEFLHRVAFGFSGLGNSLYAPSWLSSQFNSSQLSLFKKYALSQSQLYSLVGLGASLEKVNAMDSTYLLPIFNRLFELKDSHQSQPNRENSAYTNSKSSKTHHLEIGTTETALSFAFTIPGYDLPLLERLKLLIIKSHFLGPAPIPYGSPFGRFRLQTHPSFTTEPVFCQYASTGLLGLTVSAPSSAIIDKTLVDAASSILQEKTFVPMTMEQFKAAKATSKFQLAESPEKIKDFSIQLGKILLAQPPVEPSSSLPSILEVMQLFDNIEITDVHALQKRIFSAKPYSVLVGPSLTGAALQH